jgi:hypothetical protein
MKQSERILADAFLLISVRDAIGEISFTYDRQVSAEDAVSDSMDRGDSSGAAQIAVAALLPELTQVPQPIAIAAASKSILCPEHSGYQEGQPGGHWCDERWDSSGVIRAPSGDERDAKRVETTRGVCVTDHWAFINTPS